MSLSSSWKARSAAGPKHVVLIVELGREARELLRELPPAVLHGEAHEAPVPDRVGCEVARGDLWVIKAQYTAMDIMHLLRPYFAAFWAKLWFGPLGLPEPHGLRCNSQEK